MMTYGSSLHVSPKPNSNVPHPVKLQLQLWQLVPKQQQQDPKVNHCRSTNTNHSRKGSSFLLDQLHRPDYGRLTLTALRFERGSV